jgi:hypothetical protein
MERKKRAAIATQIITITKVANFFDIRKYFCYKLGGHDYGEVY